MRHFKIFSLFVFLLAPEWTALLKSPLQRRPMKDTGETLTVQKLQNVERKSVRDSTYIFLIISMCNLLWFVSWASHCSVSIVNFKTAVSKSSSVLDVFFIIVSRWLLSISTRQASFNRSLTTLRYDNDFPPAKCCWVRTSYSYSWVPYFPDYKPLLFSLAFLCGLNTNVAYL